MPQYVTIIKIILYEAGKRGNSAKSFGMMVNGICWVTNTSVNIVSGVSAFLVKAFLVVLTCAFSIQVKT